MTEFIANKALLICAPFLIAFIFNIHIETQCFQIRPFKAKTTEDIFLVLLISLVLVKRFCNTYGLNFIKFRASNRVLYPLYECGRAWLYVT